MHVKNAVKPEGNRLKPLGETWLVAPLRNEKAPDLRKVRRYVRKVIRNSCVYPDKYHKR